MPSQTQPALYPPTVAPAREGLPGLAYVAKVVINPLRGTPERAYTEPVVHYNVINTDLAWVSRPDLIERVMLHDTETFVKSPMEARVLGPTLGDGLLTASGASWKWQRKVAAPLFRQHDVQAYVPAMTAAAEAQLQAWRQRSAIRPSRLANGENNPGSRSAAPENMRTNGSSAIVSDVLADMKAATFNVILNTILNGCAPAESETIQRADRTYIRLTPWAIAAGMLQTPHWMWYPGKGTMLRASQEMRATVLALVRRRRAAYEASGEAGGDILGRLLEARNPETSEPMTDGRMVDNLATFLEAGHQTTAQALTWSLYLMALAPAWQDRVRAEVEAVAGSAVISADHVNALPVTLRVLKESMRLYPPVPVIVRAAAADCELGGIAIPKGTQVMISVYVLHRHRALWDDPDRFDPDRFLPEREQLLPRAQYMPFGFGMRTCIGMPFAYAEGVSMLATLVRGARFACDPALAPEPISQVTLSPKGGMPLSITML